MRVLVQNTLNSRQWEAYRGEAGFTIGRGEQCQVRLDSRFVSSVHASVERADSGWELHLPAGVNGVDLDGQPVQPGQRVPLPATCRLQIIEFQVVLDAADSEPETGDDNAEALINELQSLLHMNVLHRLDLRGGAQHAFKPTRARIEQINQVVEELLYGEFKQMAFEPPVSDTLLQQAFVDRLVATVSNGHAKPVDSEGRIEDIGANQLAEDAVRGIVTRLATKMGLNASDTSEEAAEQLIDQSLAEHFRDEMGQMLSNVRMYLITRQLKKQLFDMIFGFGPLQDLIRSAAVTEIMVVSPNLIYVERGGKVARHRRVFPSDAAAVSVIERIVAPIGRRIDRSQPLVDARLPDGSRVNAVIPPLAIKGPCITIRKFPKKNVTIDHLVQWRALTASAVALLDACVKGRANIIVAGGTGSGKTTLLNALSGMIPSDERIVTIEDSAELRLQQQHVVTLETRPANAEGTGEYTIRDLVKNALRMRPDRVIVGECRGGETLDMLQAMNTGHDGSMTTLHANSAEDVISRVETMVLTAVGIPIEAVRRQIADAVDLIVFTRRLTGGRRLVTQVSEVTGVDPDSGNVVVLDILKAVPAPDGVQLRPTGYMPSFLDKLIEQRLLDLDRWFAEAAA